METEIPRKGVIYFDSTLGQSSTTWVPSMRVIVMYWQHAPKGQPRLIMAVFGAEVVNGRLKLGGELQLKLVRNAAIGRRVCPACYEDGVKAPVEERGQNRGRCGHCGKAVDYIVSTYAPYFFYFTHQQNGLVIGHKTDAQIMADEMKQAMVDKPERDILLPQTLTRVSDNWTARIHSAFINPEVFDVSEMGGHGTQGNTDYDFRVTEEQLNDKEFTDAEWYR